MSANGRTEDRPTRRDVLARTAVGAAVGWSAARCAGARSRRGPWELYDLKADRGESKDLVARYPDKVRDLSAAWQRREKEFRRLAASGT